MAQIFEQALAELLKQPQPAPPAYTQDQIRQRIAQNNAQANLGIVGQLAGLEDVQNLGGQVFKQALNNRAERVTNRGTTDPLTGETAIDPEYADEKEQQRRGRIFERALAYEGQRASAAERAADKERDRDFRRMMLAQKGGTDAEMLGLRKDLLRSQIDAAKSRVGAAEDKAADKAERLRSRQDSALARAQDMLGFVDKAVGQTGFTTTGMVGNILSRVKGTDAFDLRKTVDTLKANIGFQELDAMRQASPTGGALGQVAIRELDMLQATLGSLDADQSEEQMLENLSNVRKHYQNWMKTVSQGMQDRSPSPGAPGAGPTPQPPPQPAPGPVAPSAGPGPAQTPRTRLRYNPATGGFDPA
jgi:ElaB/YqjD/DUF883 family membrane-anchored ribosome-binding protein